MALSPAVRRALNRFENAVRADEFKGSQHPDYWEAIENEYRRAKALLEAQINKEKN